MNAAPVGSSALPADCGVRRLVRSARGWGGDSPVGPANLVVVWYRSRKASSDLASGSGVDHFSCRRPQDVAGDILGALTGQLGCRESAKGVDAGQATGMPLRNSTRSRQFSLRVE
jgi:hypothetical protein